MFAMTAAKNELGDMRPGKRAVAGNTFDGYSPATLPAGVKRVTTYEGHRNWPGSHDWTMPTPIEVDEAHIICV